MGSLAGRLAMAKIKIPEKLQLNLLLEDEIEALMEALRLGQGSYTVNEGLDVISWASDIRYANLLLTMTMQGKVGLTINNGRVKARLN